MPRASAALSVTHYIGRITLNITVAPSFKILCLELLEAHIIWLFRIFNYTLADSFSLSVFCKLDTKNFQIA